MAPSQCECGNEAGVECTMVTGGNAPIGLTLKRWRMEEEKCDLQYAQPTWTCRHGMKCCLDGTRKVVVCA